VASQIVIVEQKGDWKSQYPDAVVVSADDYIGQEEYFKLRNARVINLCRSYRYLSLGYYCSLLAEARSHKVIPSVRTATDLQSKSIYGLSIEDLHETIQRIIRRKTENPPGSTFSIHIYFGQSQDEDFQDLSRQIFDLFPCPILKVDFKLNGRWQISTIRPGVIQNIPPEMEEFFIEAFKSYQTKRWRTPRAKSFGRYDLAILHNPEEKFPPSDTRALRKFVNAGKDLGVEVELITKREFSRLAEYDALFIRETTEVEHHTYRFARRAENEGIVVIDDPDSIMKCGNKIYLAELLSANKIPMPRTEILKKEDMKGIESLTLKIPYPVVLKIPDSSFSRGVHKVANPDELKKVAAQLFSESDVILAQEYLYTEFDWRVGILNRQALFVCQYFMTGRHWQIMKHTPSGGYTEGDSKTWRVEDAPEQVVKIALEAADLIGDGFYGVDLKQKDDKVVVMEINDNPSIETGVEDEVLGDDLYRIVIQEFIRRLDLRKAIQ
jgi:glutathione synthase/RimK-type ligase-like ATP-grasp enzyme